MGYIKKLKNNELVGGTDKTTIYPVTSTEAVFEEITEGNESSFKSQKTINGEHDGRIKGLENEMPDTVKSITINGGTKTYLPEDGNVELTVYSPGGEDYPGIAEAVQTNADNITAIQNEIGTDTTEDTLSGRIKSLENAVGTGGSVDQRITDAIGNINAEHSDMDPTDHIQYQITQSNGEITDLTIQGVDIASANALEALRQTYEDLSRTDIIIQNTTPVTGNEGVIYRVTGETTYTDYMFYNGQRYTMATYDIGNLDPQVSYYTCATVAATPAKAATGTDASAYALTLGGHFKVEMDEANTATSGVTLQVGNAAAKELMYNGAAVDADNTWKDGEVLAVYYYNNKYWATNAQGGGGNAEKIKYDNSQSELTASNVQGAVDEVYRKISNKKETEAISLTSGYIVTNGALNSTVDLTPQPTTGTTKYAILDITKYDALILTVQGGNVSRAYAFIDEDNKLLYAAPKNTSLNNATIDNIPNNAAKVIINDDGTATSYIVRNKDSFAFVEKDELPDIIFDEYVVDDVGNSDRLLMSQAGIKNALINTTTITREIDLTDFSKVEKKADYYLDDNGIWKRGYNDNMYGVFIKTYPNSIFRFESNDTNGSIVAILKTATVSNGGRADFASGETNRRVYSASSPVEITLPEDANYIYVYCVGANSAVFAPEDVTLAEFINIIMQASEDEPEIESLMVVPSDVTVLNAERKAHQFSDVEYTTLGSMVGAGGASISAGKKKGLPYTSCMEVDKFVGFDVTLKTFMTCVNNPYSLLYTENLYAGTSGYGFTYNGAGGSTNIGGYMGVVCNIFALHAIGMKTRFDSGSDAYLAKIGVFDKIYNQSAQGLQIGDVWWENGHNRVITNLWRSNRGLITKIEMSESVHNFPQVVAYTPSAFDSLMASKHAIIYRCNELYKNINYEASPFVAVEDEVIDSEYTYNDDICTFAGDYASFREGQIIFLNYNLKEVGSWTSIELTKGSTVVGTYTIDTSLHRYDLTSLNLTHGLYKARMSDGNGNYSDYTYFEIIDTSVIYALESGNNKRITFTSTQGKAVYLDVCTLGGRPKAKYQFTDEELTNGYAIVNISQLVAEQYNNINSGATYIKVSFQGNYGRVCSEYISTDL